MSARVEEIKKRLRQQIETGTTPEELESLVASLRITDDEWREIETWMSNERRGLREAARSYDRIIKSWLEIASLCGPGETVREVFPRLPAHLQDFVVEMVHESDLTQ